MSCQSSMHHAPLASRREFLRSSAGVLAAGTLAAGLEIGRSAHAAGSDNGAELEIAERDRQHDRMAAFLAVFRGKGGQISGNKRF